MPKAISADTSLQALVLCSDDKILRVLRRILSDLEIAVDCCSDADSAVRKLTRRRFEAVVVDCHDEDVAAQVLASVRSAPCNKRSIAVAMIDGQKAVRSAFGLGAHFVLYKPISAERARTSFRAARALMKCERRRNVRVSVEIPIAVVGGSAGRRKIVTSDISLGGMSLKLSRRPGGAAPMRIRFTLPGTEHAIECAAEVAWEGRGAQAGIRFVDLHSVHRDQLKAWLVRHSPEMEPDDPPVSCTLTDLSLGGCYLEMPSPFPIGTRIVLIMRVAQLENRVEGVVRVMHPEIGMGVEFIRASHEQRQHLEKFIDTLRSGNGVQPELVVEPEGMSDTEPDQVEPPTLDEIDDPLLDLFRKDPDFTVEGFRSELRKQRSPSSAAPAAAIMV